MTLFFVVFFFFFFVLFFLFFVVVVVDAPPTPILSNVSVTGWESTSLVDIVNITIKLNT